MNKQEIVKLATSFMGTSTDNYLKKEIAISEDLAGMKIFEDPILAFGDAEDDYFETLKDELDEYCSMCGACSRQCPVNAISMETGKVHQLCYDF